MVVKWRCKSCGALHDGNTALGLLLASSFVPVEVEEPKPVRRPESQPPRFARPVLKEILKEPEEPEEEEETEDLSLE